MTVENPSLGCRITITGKQIKSLSLLSIPPMQHNYCQHFYRKASAKEHDIPWLSISCSSLSFALKLFYINAK